MLAPRFPAGERGAVTPAGNLCRSRLRQAATGVATVGYERLDSAALLARSPTLPAQARLETAQRGVIELRSLIYFLSLIGLALAGTMLAVDARRGG